jgi:hypothetical protein
VVGVVGFVGIVRGFIYGPLRGFAARPAGRCAGGFQIIRQGIQLRFPEDAVRLDPGSGVLHRSWSEAAAVDPAVDFAVEQAGGFEDPQVLGDGRE